MQTYIIFALLWQIISARPSSTCYDLDITQQEYLSSMCSKFLNETTLQIEWTQAEPTDDLFVSLKCGYRHHQGLLFFGLLNTTSQVLHDLNRNFTLNCQFVVFNSTKNSEVYHQQLKEFMIPMYPGENDIPDPIMEAYYESVENYMDMDFSENDQFEAERNEGIESEKVPKDVLEFEASTEIGNFEEYLSDVTTFTEETTGEMEATDEPRITERPETNEVKSELHGVKIGPTLAVLYWFPKRQEQELKYYVECVTTSMASRNAVLLPNVNTFVVRDLDPEAMAACALVACPLQEVDGKPVYMCEEDSLKQTIITNDYKPK